jgi:hypothetical protein
VTVRSCFPRAALLWAVLGLAPVALAADPVPSSLPPGFGTAPVSVNQQQAEHIVTLINQSGRVHDYQIDVIVRGNLVELIGKVADQPQHDEVIRLVQGIPGVDRVLDRLASGAGLAELTRVQAPVPLGGAPPRLPEPTPGEVRPQAPGAATIPVPAGPIPEPQPMGMGPAPGPYDMAPPRMPPYAWSTYAPYNNFSRVAVPEAYPYNAWPFIGPMYPFPKIPLGWRSVKLEWDDGYWWFSRVGTKYDWWRLRFW